MRLMFGFALGSTIGKEGLHAKMFGQKRPHVCVFLDDLRGWFPCSVSGLGLNPDQHWIFSSLHLLKPRRKLKTVARDNTVIGVGRRD